jgi:hypothetical protein
MCSVSTAALAQNVTNEAWIGQTGETNTISILQQGNSNQAGADNTAHRINQDGRFNILSIDQYGWSNAAGAAEIGVSTLPEGLNQRGDRNSLSIIQRNLLRSGLNFVGAVFQSSVPGGGALANVLAVIQDEVGGDGNAAHGIGSVTQINTESGQAANRAALTQTGGIESTGNTIERLFQRGFANIARITQSANRNSVALARQQGADNHARIEQGSGEQNTVGVLDQTGMHNTVAISQSGNRNHIARVFQYNHDMAISGNRMKITIAGDDNGGDNLGGPAGFRSEFLRYRSNAYQGGFTQIGDGNDISYTVNGGDGNLAGITQDGFGNGAIVAIGRGTQAMGSTNNEVGIVQLGDGNDLSLNIVGDANVDGIAIEGDKNMLRLRQRGNENSFDIRIAGDNNNSGSNSTGSFGGRLVALASNAQLLPGIGVQEGTGNIVTVDLTGNSNLFAFKQSGQGNGALLIVNGVANHSAFDQSGSSSQAQIKQSGSRNSMGIVQF